MPTPNTDFLHATVLASLQEHGFNKLSAADQVAYLPQFMAEAERRLGLKLTPYLNTDASAAEFNKLLQQETSPEQWHAFWNSHVPNFAAVVQQTLNEFAKEVSAAFAM